MTTIPALFNTGTGRSSISSPQSQIPSQVENLVVLNQLTVNGNSFLQSDVEVGETLAVIGNSNLASVGISGDLSVGGVTSVASIGTDVNSQFQLPATSGSQNQVLTIASENPTITEWTDKSTVNDDFVKYDPVNEVLINSVTGVESNIDDLRLTSIGQSSAPFQLPATAPASDGDVLSILNSGANPPTTEWKAIAGVSDFVSYNPSTFKLVNNESNGTVSDVNFLRVGELNNNVGAGFVEFRRTDANANLNIDRTTRFKFDDILDNGGGITMQSAPNSGIGLQANLLVQVDPLNNQTLMRASTVGGSKQVTTNITEASLSSVNGVRINKVETTNTRVILSSEAPGVGFNQSGIVFSTGASGTQYCKMPENQPAPRLTMRLKAIGTPPNETLDGLGTQSNPYLMEWAL
jgi:hypothetical protein